MKSNLIFYNILFDYNEKNPKCEKRKYSETMCAYIIYVCMYPPSPMEMAPAATSAMPAVRTMDDVALAPERPAAKAKGTVRPSETPIMISRTISPAVKCFSLCWFIRSLCFSGSKVLASSFAIEISSHLRVCVRVRVWERERREWWENWRGKTREVWNAHLK